MWNSIKINNENYFFQLNPNCENDEYSYILFDFKEVLIENCSKSEILLRAKDLNKRIEFDEITVLETISNSPADSNIWYDSPNRSCQRNLEVKYYLSDRPFKFLWKLQSTDANEFKKLITYPMLLSIKCLVQQTKELKDIIMKKDVEIEQYKLDGVELKRTTVATEKFNVNNFDNRYSKINPIAKTFLNIIEKTQDLNIVPNELSIDPSITTNSERLDKIRKSPKTRKRKNYETQRNMTQFRLKTECKINYEDSDSSNPSQSENIDIKGKLIDLRKNLRELEQQSNEDFLNRKITK